MQEVATLILHSLSLFDFFFVYPIFLEKAGESNKRKKGFRKSNFSVTWLILPVVICLSQRLSHACLSMNEIIQ